DPEQDQAREREAADERIALLMNGRNLRANGVGDRHQGSPSSSPPAGGFWHSSHSAAAGVTSVSSTGGGTRLGASFSSAIRADLSRASCASLCRLPILA